LQGVSFSFTFFFVFFVFGVSPCFKWSLWIHVCIEKHNKISSLHVSFFLFHFFF
jgi:hypothetical protein